MKKLLITTSLVLSLATIGAHASGKTGRVGVPNFRDTIVVNYAGVTPKFQEIGEYNHVHISTDPAPSCDTTTKQCTFVLAGDNSWQDGSVSVRLGDETGAYCDVQINDGALAPSATLGQVTCHGATNSALMKTQAYQYSMTLNASN